MTSQPTPAGRRSFWSPEFLEEVERHASRLAEHLGPEWLAGYLEATEARVLADMRRRRRTLDRLAREVGAPDCRSAGAPAPEVDP